MQYGVELYPYERVNKADKGKNTKKTVSAQYIIKMGVYFVAAFLISRVILINSTAPFGIAALIAVSLIKEEKAALISGLGTFLGYLTLYKNVNEIGSYFILIATITCLGYVIKKLNRINKSAVIFTVIFVETLAYKILIVRLTAGVALLTAFFQIACIFPLYFIIDYSIICFKDYKTKHLFNSEELISMAITASLIVAGTWGTELYGVSLRNILALALVLIFSYVNGSGIGSAAGVAMGIIVGMSSKNMTVYISIYALCGLIPGIFKETGKWFSAIAYLVASFILIIYSNLGSQFKIIEALISCGIFLMIPSRYYSELALEFDKNKKEEKIKEGYIIKIKNILTERLNEFSEVLFNMSDILYNLVDNDKLAQKGKSSALIENLADRVCSSCNMNSMCWKRELHYTYSAFSELIENFQDNRRVVPDEIERKCVKRTALQKHTEQIVNNHIINEMWRNRLSEGRELLASQIGNMAQSVHEIMDEFNSDIKFNNEMDKRVRSILEKNNIDIEDSLCFEDRNDRLVIKLTMKACGGRQACVKELLPFINEVSGKTMVISDEGCRIDASTKNCTITFEEMPKFHVSTCVVRQCKDGEKYNGDNYSFVKLKDGTHMSVISDGMGSGPQAGQESKAVIDLIEKLTTAGFSKITAINTANSVMTLKFSENEKFSTVDLSSINLYTGEVEFMKVGAVPSFIKSGNKVITINSKTLPIGVLDKADVEVNTRKIKSGDMIIMMSDGIIDYNNQNAGNPEWVVEYLESCESLNPKIIADGLIEKNKELSGGKVNDDMTVLVSKVFNLY